MQLQTKTVRQGINKAYLKVNVKRADLDAFKIEATRYLNQIEEAGSESEEHLKGYLKDFLSRSFYEREEKLVNTSDRIDLAIYSGKTTSSSVDVIIEAKRPDNKAEMISKDNPNRKALQEALHYYFDQRESGNDDLKQVVVTNYIEFFIFDAREIERHFYSKKKLLKTYRQWKNDEKVSGKTDFIYQKFEAFINESDADITVTHADLSKYQKQLAAEANEESDKKLIPLYKLFSPEHLVKKNFANDSNSLDKGFYNELLHILGLQEVKEKGSRLIQRLPKKERHRGSLIENTIEILRYDQHMNEVRDATVHYGDEEDDQLFGVALELVITWMNRVLFLKLMEAQLLAYHQYDEKFKFLSYETIDEYDELNKLFFRVLALRNQERPASVQERFGHIPYLNSSLFDSTRLEKTTIQISGLDDKATLDLHSRSILKKGAKPPKEKLSTLDYLLRFLDAYNFSAESSGGIQTEDKTLINASVLGLIFEKINGYKDGSFFTPGFITEYMARETLRKSVTDKLNEAFGWDCESFDELPRKIEAKELSEVNEVINSITICDPAVGSGHFLVSYLNELIAIKSELKVLTDHEGKYISRLDISVENDELAIEHNGELFDYKLNHHWKNGRVERKPAGKESQRIQEALFHEKKFLIENCLFGVDINPNSVKICRLRLWIELLKHAYYTSGPQEIPDQVRDDNNEEALSPYSELEVLPNIDINIKQGNSLVSRFGLDEDLSSIFKKSEHSLHDYKQAVRNYRETRDRNEKQRLQTLIDDIKAEYSENLLNNKPINKKLSKARGKLELMQNEDLFGEGKATKKELKKQEKKVTKLEEQKAEEEAGAFYREAFEWRFEFPEVLDEDGKYTGFDVVIGNPPYVRQEALGDIKPFLKTHFEVYAGTADLYAYFIEQGVKLNKENGYFHYIVANKWMRANYGKPLRTWLQQKQITAITDFGDLPVFEEATTYPCLLEIKKSDNPTVFKALEVENLPVEDFDVLEEEHAFEVDASKLSEDGWSLKPIAVQNLFDKIAKSSIKLGEYTNDKILSGIKTGANDVYIIDESTKNKIIKEDPKSKEVIKPVLGGSDIQKYIPPKIEQYLLFIPWHFPLHEDSSITGASKKAEEVFKKEYPGAFNYLLSHKEKLSSRNKSETGIRYEWYALQRCAATYFEEFEKPKLILPDISKRGNFTFDSRGEFYIQNSAYIIGKADKFLLGILNSNLIAFFYRGISSSYRGGYLRFINQYLQQIPIKESSFEDRKEIDGLVTQILTAKKENPEADTGTLEAEIDQLVYQLYGLTEEEIAIVEESVG
ncbi:Eco57I restriction-modification methylase domain-containing protein [Gracilimonas sediminicola]|uniref:type IIG restriction enzyme/methyltransferase n=1 Tax=Gracilimonas sediminicola TaxID=2952158 RepID=UPI0038D42630